MDFIHLVKSKQNELNLTDKQVSEKSGLSEYVFYNLVKYRTYLTRLSYFALSSVLGLSILSEDEISLIIEENKKLVGTVESNLYLAENFIDEKKVEFLEKELSRLKEAHLSVESKNKVINSQYKEIESLRKEIDILKKNIDEKVREAYSNGIKDGSSKVSNLHGAYNDSLIEALNEEYTDKISKLEMALKKVELSYSNLYREVLNKNLVADLNGFEKPLLLSKEELGLNLDGTLISDILLKYYEGNVSVENVASMFGIPESEVENIVVNYAIIEKNGVKSYVKRQ